MKPLRILCDVDGVLADFVGLVLDYVQRNTGLSYLHSAVDQWDCLGALGLADHWPYFRAQCDELGLCRTMRELPGARAFYAELGRLGTVRVCTSPMTCAWYSQRAEWLVAFGVPIADHLFVHDKHDLAGSWDVLIDDKAENCEAFAQAGGVAWCIATPYNAHVRVGFMSLPGGPSSPGSCEVRRGTHAECLAWLRGL